MSFLFSSHSQNTYYRIPPESDQYKTLSPCTRSLFAKFKLRNKDQNVLKNATLLLAELETQVGVAWYTTEYIKCAIPSLLTERVSIVRIF